jgi:Asp-tRNA(Asn)/Glu-tRNA(Gln) amidotransferase A subunit family amidase
VGVKDIFDTADLPTEDGTPLHAGRTPAYDATAVARLRTAGAVILGKTVTAELAVCTPGKTRNPHDPARTPGGSSSGSAAAVAAGMVPLAIGTQTNGSVIRPASYCGVVGYKPSFGLISRYRVLRESRFLDQVGVFSRTVEDAALLAEQLIGFDERDPDTVARAYPQLTALATQPPPVTPRLALVKTPAWSLAEQDARQAFAELAEFLGSAVEEVDLDELLAPAVDWHRSIMEADLARSFRREYQRGSAQLSPALREILERGQQILAVDYVDALERVPGLRSALAEFLLEYDAILTPAATGEAPLGLESTGSPVFCTPWTLCGMPAVSLPLLQGANGLPLGVQLVAARGDDARLLRTANWLAGRVAGA